MKKELKAKLTTELAKAIVAVLDSNPTYKGWRQDFRASLEANPLNFPMSFSDGEGVSEAISDALREVTEELLLSDGTLPPKIMH